MNNFIVGPNGFLKSIIFDVDKKEHVIEWTPLLREAQRFNSKSAHVLIKGKQIEAFVWNPYKEEHVRSKWEVVQRRDYYSISSEKEHKSLEWKPERVVMEKKTDVSFLTSNGAQHKVYYDSYKEALEVCQEKNLEIIKELQEKIEKMNLRNN